MKTVLTAGIAVLALSACATPAPAYFTINSTFDESEIAWSKLPGSNSIKASGMLRQAGGGVVTCAGSNMNLLPAGTHATERMTTAYGNRDHGYIPVNQNPFMAVTQLPEASASYRASMKTRTCDPQGFASFIDLPDGEYYLTTEVRWGVPGAYGTMNWQGGSLMQRVQVSGGKLHETVLTN